jgi:hypothetical protein
VVVSGANARWRTLGDDSIISCRLFILDLRFVNEHNRNIVANWIDALALDTFQTAAVGLQLNFRAAGGANQNLKQLFTNGHGFQNLSIKESRAVWQCGLAKKASLAALNDLL